MNELERVLRPWAGRLLETGDLTRGTPVVVACSGGPDSLALLALARTVGLAVTAVYVDHGLRAGTAHDARVVRKSAGSVGASFRVVNVDVPSGGNLEARARDARYGALEEARTVVGADAVLVGHTRDDQAETVLLGLLRGSATAGLAGMAGRRGSVRRPLLGMRRAETREICARLGWTPVHDPMNDELHHRRVWLRREVMPRLERTATRDLVEVLARQADIMREESQLLDSLVAGSRADDVATLNALPNASARRLVRNWLGSPPPSLAAVDAVLDVARGARRAADLPGGVRVERAGGRLHVLRADPAASESAPAPARLPLPGRAEFGQVTIEAWVDEGPPVAWPDGRLVTVADADRVGPEATVRVARPGERFRPLGRGGSKLVRDALLEAGFPASRRVHAPLVTAGAECAVPADAPLWVVGYRVDDRVRVTARTRRYLWMSVEPA